MINIEVQTICAILIAGFIDEIASCGPCRESTMSVMLSSLRKYARAVKLNCLLVDDEKTKSAFENCKGRNGPKKFGYSTYDLLDCCRMYCGTPNNGYQALCDDARDTQGMQNLTRCVLGQLNYVTQFLFSSTDQALDNTMHILESCCMEAEQSVKCSKLKKIR